jgi:nitrous oxidase accessory protein
MAKDIYVKGSVADAVKYAEQGDRLIIPEGIYYENNIIIDKPLTLEGINFPVIDGKKELNTIIIRSSGVNIKGISLINSGASSSTDYSGLRIESCSDINISGNRFNGNFFTIYLSNVKNCILRNNIIISDAHTESFSGNGIHAWKSNNITIEYNDISGCRDGIYFEFVTNSLIRYNRSHSNLRYGLHFMFSEGNIYEKNKFESNGAGVAVMYTKNIKMIDNEFTNNWGANAYGLLLKEISNSVIKGNKFIKNTTGIYLEGCNALFISGNTISENGWALKILGNCYGDTLIRNNFSRNTFDVSTNSSVSNNIFSYNYWDKYKGYDLDKNGTGDIPYRPVSLFSLTVETIPSSITLLRSFLVDILDAAEKTLPSIIPESLIDNEPSMFLYD